MSGIQIENLKKDFGHFNAISQISLSIPEGSFCVLLGPSGCGKSTTLNCIAGLEDVTSGSIKIGGREVTSLPPHARDIAMVFQSSLLYPHLTALQNIRMSLKNTDTPAAEAERRISHAVEILEISSELSKKPAAMSGGQRQRVAMAKAIVRNPAAFLMDEPLAALDAALRQSLRTQLVALQKRLGTTTIFVTHDQVEAMTMGDLIVVMNEGRIEQMGSSDEIYNNPRTRFVAGFIGSPPMNFIDGSLEASSGEIYLTTPSGRFQVPARLGRDLSGNGPASLGIRPQDLRVSTTSSANAIAARIFAIENLGKEAIIILNDDTAQTFRSIVAPGHSYRIGDPVFLIPDLKRAHLFT